MSSDDSHPHPPPLVSGTSTSLLYSASPSVGSHSTGTPHSSTPLRPSFSGLPSPHDDHPSYPCSADEYDIYAEIGIGAFATVYRGVLRSTNEEVAIKVIDLDQFNTNWEEIRREILIMSLLHHHNIVPIKCSFVDGQDLWIVMQLYEAGSCAAIMKHIAPTGFKDEALIATILKESLMGLIYLHKDGNIHRDLKAGNILIGKDAAVALGDFGVAGTFMENGERKHNRSTFTGTPCWMAPEVMEHSGSYDDKADIWSFGITGLELGFGRAPYAKYPPMKIILMTLQLEPPTCFAESDTRVLTNRGFKALYQIEELIENDDEVEFACYDRARKGIVYRRGTLLITTATQTQMVTFNGREETSNHFSIRVTDNHLMFAKREGSVEVPVSFEISSAKSLLTECNCVAGSSVRMQCHAENGLVETEGSSDELGFVKSIGLNSRDEIDAFLELYGYWILRHCEVRESQSVGFEVRGNDEWVRDRVRKLGLKDVEWREEIVSGRLSSIVIDAERWVKFFEIEIVGDLMGHWVLNSLQMQQMCLVVGGLYEASGLQMPDRRIILTSSHALCDQIVALLLHCGYSSWFDVKGGLWEVSYICDVDGLSVCSPTVSQRDIAVTSYIPSDGRLWCVEVDHPDHLIFAQRVASVRDYSESPVVTSASRSVIVGNCEIYHDRSYEFSKNYHSMIAKCLRKDPTKRPSAKKLLEHKFFKQAKDRQYIIDKIIKKLPPTPVITEKIHICKEKSTLDKQKMEKSKPVSVGSWSFDPQEYEEFKKRAIAEDADLSGEEFRKKQVAKSYHANDGDSSNGSTPPTPTSPRKSEMPSFEPPNNSEGEHKEGRFTMSDDDPSDAADPGQETTTKSSAASKPISIPPKSALKPNATGTPASDSQSIHLTDTGSMPKDDTNHIHFEITDEVDGGTKFEITDEDS